MANELKPCPFCNSTDVSVNRSEITCMSWVSCTSCGLETPSETGVTDEQVISYWNTRRAAPVEGLERFGYRTDSIHDFDGTYLHDDTYLAPSKNGDWVKYSQAEAIIAAERAEKELAQQAEEEAKDLFWSVYGVYLAKGGVPVSTDKARSALSNKIATLEADNAALTARVKELGDERYKLAYAIAGGEDAPGYLDSLSVETLVEVARDNSRRWFAETDRAEALETQLAAARKAINTPIEAVDFLYKHGDLTYGAAKQAIDLLVSNGFYVGKRAALEAKP